jgi:hypothetical protein
MGQSRLILVLFVFIILDVTHGQQANPTDSDAENDPNVDLITAPIPEKSTPSSRQAKDEDDSLNNVDASSLDKGCTCVEYYRCNDKDVQTADDGSDIIDLREAQAHFKKCGSFSVCCKNPLQPSTTPVGQPDTRIQGTPSDVPVSPEPDDTTESTIETAPPGAPIPPAAPVPPADPIPPADPTPAPPCGIRNSVGLTNRIVNLNLRNDDSKFGEFPWQAAIIQIKDGEFVFIGGGALISPKFVLTAPHIFRNATNDDLLVRLGEYDLKSTKEEFQFQDLRVRDIIIHPQVNYRNGLNDIAILELEPEAKMAPNIGPICLPDDRDVYENMRCTVTGWGKNKFGKEGTYQSVMKVVDLPLVNNAQCQEMLRLTKLGPRFQLFDKFRCAGGEEGFDACHGDGGGPLTCVRTHNGQDFYTLAGIVAWGVGCGEQDVPGVYIDIVQYVDWIDDVIAIKS